MEDTDELAPDRAGVRLEKRQILTWPSATETSDIFRQGGLTAAVLHGGQIGDLVAPGRKGLQVRGERQADGVGERKSGPQRDVSQRENIAGDKWLLREDAVEIR